ncbi:hypothetical protein SH139x_004044 [Planctomycetaceae bacterium SH139]
MRAKLAGPVPAHLVQQLNLSLRSSIDEYHPPNELVLFHAEHPWILRRIESEIPNGIIQRTGTPKSPPDPNRPPPFSAATVVPF